MLNWINFILVCILWLSPYPALGFLYLVIWVELYRAASKATVEDFWQSSSIPDSIFDTRKAMYQLGRSQQNNQAIGKYWRQTLPKIAQKRLNSEQLLRQLGIISPIQEEGPGTEEEEEASLPPNSPKEKLRMSLNLLGNSRARYGMTNRGVQQQSLNDLKFQNPLYRQVQRASGHDMDAKQGPATHGDNVDHNNGVSFSNSEEQGLAQRSSSMPSRLNPSCSLPLH